MNNPNKDGVPEGAYFWEPAERGHLCVIRFKAPHYTGNGEIVARGIELVLAKQICSLLNAAALPFLVQPQAGIGVKELVWHHTASDEWTAWPLLPGPGWVIQSKGDLAFVLDGCEYASLGDAKAAAQTEWEARINSALSQPLPSPQGEAATHRHKKRGAEYVLIGMGKMQTSGWRDNEAPKRSNGEPPYVDMRGVAVYRSVDDGQLWVRPREEFEDGRFEPLQTKEPGNGK